MPSVAAFTTASVPNFSPTIPELLPIASSSPKKAKDLPVCRPLHITTSCDCNRSMSTKKMTNGAAVPKGKLTNGVNGVNGKVNGNGNTSMSSERVSEFLSSLMTTLNEAPDILPEIESLGKVCLEHEELSRRMAEKETDFDKREKELQAVIDSKDALLNKTGKMWIDTMRNDLSMEHNSAGKLQEKEKEMAQMMAAHKVELTKLKKDLEDSRMREQKDAGTKFEMLKKESDQALLAMRKERDEALKDVEQCKISLDQLSAKLSEAKTLLEAEILYRKKSEAEIAKITQDIGVEELTESDFEKQAVVLESKFHALCKDVFYNIEIPFNPTDEFHDGLKRELVDSGFVSRKEATGDFPLMLSNTSWSRAILMSFAENIIATQLTEGIFRLVPMPPGSLDSKKTTEYLEMISNNLSGDSMDNEARWRSLSCIAMEKDPEARTQVVESILDRLAEIFTPLFRRDPSALDLLLDRLSAFFTDAMDFWSTAQHSKQRIVADMVLDMEPGDCDYHPEHTDINVPDEELHLDETSGPLPLPLFPRFSILDVDGFRTLYDGKSLPPTAPSAIRSRAESKQYKRTQSEKLRARLGSGASTVSRPHGGRRRQSISSAAAPRSPTASTRTPIMARPPAYIGSGVLGIGSASGASGASGASSPTGGGSVSGAQ